MTNLVLTASSLFHIDAILDFFRDIKRNAVRRSAINSTIKELSALTDKELWDIGISRGEIYDIAHSSFPAETNKNLGGWV